MEVAQVAPPASANHIGPGGAGGRSLSLLGPDLKLCFLLAFAL